jgi:hypothetical protein
LSDFVEPCFKRSVENADRGEIRGRRKTTLLMLKQGREEAVSPLVSG